MVYLFMIGFVAVLGHFMTLLTYHTKILYISCRLGFVLLGQFWLHYDYYCLKLCHFASGFSAS